MGRSLGRGRSRGHGRARADAAAVELSPRALVVEAKAGFREKRRVGRTSESFYRRTGTCRSSGARLSDSDNPPDVA